MFTSPEYPQPYPHQRECVWKIDVRAGSSIQLTITDFDVEKHETCDYDVLEVSSIHTCNFVVRLLTREDSFFSFEYMGITNV